MQSEVTVSKWGNSLAVRIPHRIAKQAAINEGDALSLALQNDGSLVLRSTRRTYKLADLVSGIKRDNRHRETDWGSKQGEEAW